MRKPLIHTHCHLICCVYIKGCVSIHIVWCWRCWDRLKIEIKVMSKMSKMVFAAFTQHYIQNTVTHLTHVKGVKDVKYYVLCIQWLLTPARREGYLLQYSIWKAFHLGGVAVHHQSVQGGSFLGLVKLQGWLQARHTANPQFLKLMGAQQPSNSYQITNKAASSIP